MLIKQFCEATGLPRDTVRFYVKQGLLTPDIGSRESNRYQVFDAAQVERAKLIKAAQRLGFSLKEIAEFGKAYETQSLSTEAKAELLRSRLAGLDDQARLLRSVRDYLSAKLTWLEGGEIGAPPVLGRPTAGNLGARLLGKVAPKRQVRARNIDKRSKAFRR
jgi:DNA-binding transcriptional MerR regulator